MFGLFKKWECVEATVAIWEDRYRFTEYRCLYEIMHCEKTDEYKLVVSGHNPKEHNMYPKMIERLNEYKTKHLNYVK